MARQYFNRGTCCAPWQEWCPQPPLALARPPFCFGLKMFKLTMEQRNLTLTGFLLKHYVVSNTRVLTLNSHVTVTVERFDFLFLYSFFQDICCGTGALGLCLAQVLVCYIIYSKLSNSRALGHFSLVSLFVCGKYIPPCSVCRFSYVLHQNRSFITTLT